MPFKTHNIIKNNNKMNINIWLLDIRKTNKEKKDFKHYRMHKIDDKNGLKSQKFSSLRFT